MSFFTDLLESETVAGVRAKLVGFAQAAGLEVTDWIDGAVSDQILETVVAASYLFTQAVARVTRGFASLDTATDPGDVDSFDAGNVNLTPGPGFLSYFGQNTFSTTREEETFADGFVLFVNAGIVARTFAPEALVFTWTGGSPPSPAPTYRNSADPTIYTNPDGTVTVNAGASLSIPVTAEEIGIRSNAPPSSLSLTTVLLGCTATNPAAVLGSDREAADVYRARCRQAADRISLGGPGGAYAYLAAKNLDGTPLLNASGDAVGITRIQESESSATGIVTVYYASDSGVPIGADVTAANTNISIEAFAVPDAITFTGAAASAVSIHVTGTAKVKAKVGVTATAVKNAIVAALVSAFKTYPIGGVDQVSGAGVIYTADLQAVAAGSYPGLYDVLVTLPAGATTPLALGQVATVNTTAGDWTVTVVA